MIKNLNFATSLTRNRKLIIALKKFKLSVHASSNLLLNFVKKKEMTKENEL